MTTRFLCIIAKQVCLFLSLSSQRQEEVQNSSRVSTMDIDNEAVIALVSDAVTAIFNRLHSKAACNCVYMLINFKLT